jgi:hypothetical protein
MSRDIRPQIESANVQFVSAFKRGDAAGSQTSIPRGLSYFRRTTASCMGRQPSARFGRT